MAVEIQKYLELIPSNLSTTAHVKTIFGDPVESHGRTIIPVARVQYGFGGGLGGRSRHVGEAAERSEHGEGGGGGGGVLCLPLGVIEISATGTWFLPIRRASRRKMAAAVTAGLAIGWMLFRR